MCGIGGTLDGPGTRPPADVAAMAASLRHRGPDETDVWVDRDAGVGFAHTRLAIIDLTAAGHQPMTSASGRWTLTYNGEIYNHEAIRDELAALGHRFRGRSDTEVLLTAIERWGVAGAAERCNGMFAFAAWDRDARALSLARDRLGEKPLYYGWLRGRFVFASELKAIAAVAADALEIDRDALALYFRYKYVPAPWSIYRGVRKLPAGATLMVTASDAPTLPPPTPYWSLGDAARSERSIGDREAVDAVEAILGDAVRLRMTSDVPLGALLSGGVDSSLVVAMMQRSSASAIRTFTIGFEDAAFDESAEARAVANHLGTDHTELTVTSADALDVVPRLASMYDEPFADSSQIPTHLVSTLARRHVTVALSGDGGDELFGGYNRHVWIPAIWRTAGRVPPPARHVMARALGQMSPDTWDRWVRRVERYAPARFTHRTPGDKLHKVADALASSSPEDMYLRQVSHWQDPAALVLSGDEPATLPATPAAWPVGRDLATRLMHVDAATYLPDDILVKVDRASMAVGLEVRVPMLDPRLVELAFSLPASVKIREGSGKWILRQVLHRHVPERLVSRPKAGFGVPIGSWLRGPLRAWADDLLSEDRLRRDGVLDHRVVRSLWASHLAGRTNGHYRLWDVLMFQAWSDAWSPYRSPSPAAVR